MLDGYVVERCSRLRDLAALNCVSVVVSLYYSTINRGIVTKCFTTLS
jgi:hypothetical protein